MNDDRSLNILLVEDDDVDVLNVQRAFRLANITNPLTSVKDGVEALERLRSDDFPAARRLVLLDLNLPRMNGIEFLREVRKDPVLKPTCVVVLTTSDHEKDKIDAFDLNVAGYLLKPVTLIKFVETMAAIIKYWTLGEMPSA
jgi:CheY-like chemotaxis protein